MDLKRSDAPSKLYRHHFDFCSHFFEQFPKIMVADPRIETRQKSAESGQCQHAQIVQFDTNACCTIMRRNWFVLTIGWCVEHGSPQSCVDHMFLMADQRRPVSLLSFVWQEPRVAFSLLSFWLPFPWWCRPGTCLIDPSWFVVIECLFAAFIWVWLVIISNAENNVMQFRRCILKVQSEHEYQIECRVHFEYSLLQALLFWLGTVFSPLVSKAISELWQNLPTMRSSNSFLSISHLFGNLLCLCCS